MGVFSNFPLRIIVDFFLRNSEGGFVNYKNGDPHIKNTLHLACQFQKFKEVHLYKNT